MDDSIFTKIIRGEIPCHKIYEDDFTFAFLDINPIQTGHTLVVPKRQVESVWQLSEQDYQALMSAGHKVAKRLAEVFPEKSHVGMIIEGLEVPHAHLNIFPFDNDAEFRAHSRPESKPDANELTSLASKISF